MKKITSLVMTALLITTVSGCTSRNTAMRNNNIYPNQGTTQGTRTGYQTGTTQGTYRDGVYTGVGNSGAVGNQTATVVIRAGRITNITLGTIDSKGNIISPQNMGTIQSTTGNTNMGNNTQYGSTNNYANQGARTYGTPGVTTGGMAGGMANNVSDNNTIGNTGRTGVGTNNGNLGYGDNKGSLNYGSYGTTTGGVNTGRTTGNPDYDRVRRDLAAAMINAQTYDVNLNQNNTSVAQNWKLAVSRALDRARY